MKTFYYGADHTRRTLITYLHSCRGINQRAASQVRNSNRFASAAFSFPYGTIRISNKSPVQYLISVTVASKIELPDRTRLVPANCSAGRFKRPDRGDQAETNVKSRARWTEKRKEKDRREKRRKERERGGGRRFAAKPKILVSADMLKPGISFGGLPEEQYSRLEATPGHERSASTAQISK